MTTQSTTPVKTGTALPPEAWNRTLSQFRGWMSPCTEAPEEYMFASAFALVGLAIGRNVYVQVGRRLYANSLIGLLGPAATKKGTPWALLNTELISPHIDLARWNLRIILGTGSAEGLLERFMEEEEVKDSKGKTHRVLKPVPERRVMTIEEELGYFLVKSHSDATANLREITCQLWDGVDVSPPTRSRSLYVVKPFYSMLSMTTPETLEARLDEDDILTGLLPRFIFFTGTPREPIAWPETPNSATASSLAGLLGEISRHAENLRKSGQDYLQPTRAARTAWEEIYPKLRKKALNAPSPPIGRMLARVEVHIVKAALLYAMCAGHSAIEEEDLGHALALGDYILETAMNVASTQMGGEVRRVEYKIIMLLEQNPGKWFKVRELQQRLSGRVDADRFHKAIRALIKLGRLEAYPPGEAERPKSVRARG